MNSLLTFLLRLYLPICTAIFLGIILSFGFKFLNKKKLPGGLLYSKFPYSLGKFLFFVGVPISVINFIHKADLSGAIWLSPLTAWGAILLGLGCSWLWLQSNRSQFSISAQKSFTLVSIVGNTGYFGFPIILLLPQLGPDYFAWAILYDVLGTFFGAYGLGVFLASRRASTSPIQFPTDSLDNALSPMTHGKDTDIAKIIGFLRDISILLAKNPTMIAFLIGLALRRFTFPESVDIFLHWFAWGVIMASLVLMGIRLQQLDSWANVKTALGAVTIKMFLVPLIVAMVLTTIGLSGPPRLVLLLQSAMPCAFATLVLAEAYDLDKDLVVTALGLSSLALFFMLPFWLWGFATW